MIDLGRFLSGLIAALRANGPPVAGALGSPHVKAYCKPLPASIYLPLELEFD